MLTKNKIKNEGINPEYYKKLAKVESSGNPNAQASTSSAAGLFQFTKGTWEDMVNNLGLNYTLEDRFDPKKSRKVVEAFTKNNAKYLENKIGREPGENELYLAHFLGVGGASKFLKGYKQFPDMDVSNIVSNSAIKANPNVFLNKDGSTKTMRDIYNWSAKKFGIKGYEAPKDESIWGLNEQNQVVSVNPEFATDKDKKYSDLIKKDYVRQQFETEEVEPQESFTNLPETQKNTTFAEPVPEDSEVPQWKKDLDKKQKERDMVLSFVTQQGLDYVAPEYKRVQPQPTQPQQFQDGGEIPTDPNGVYSVGKRPVRVPTKDGKITMKGVNYPILGIANTGEEILMQPNQEYHFKNATEVLEIPQI